jgi:PAS domain S-box-containing protein
MARNGLFATARLALLVVAAGLLAATLMAFISTNRLGRSNDELRHTLAVLLAVDDVMALIRDAESGARGYIISDRDDFLEPYRVAAPRIAPAVARLAEVTRADPLVRAEAARLGGLILERQALLESSLRTYRARGRVAAQAEIAEGRGKRLMDDIRVTVADLRRKQALRGDDLQRRHDGEERAAEAATFGAAAAGALLALAGLWFSQRHRRSLEAGARIEAEAAARLRSEQAIRTIMNRAHAAIVVLDERLRAAYVNARFYTLFGWTPEQLLEPRPCGPFPPELVAQRDALLDRFRSERERGQGELVFLSPDGGRRHAYVRWRRIDEPHFPGRYIVTIDDVTELNMARERIRELALRLERVRDAQNEETALRLHEGIAQDLFAAKLSVGALARAGDRQPGIIAACADAEQMLTSALTGIRAVMKDLRPGGAAHLPLGRVLREHADDLARRAGVPVSIDAESQAELPPALKLTLLRAIEEALGNVARHARAGRVDVVLREDEEALELTIADDGVGLVADYRNRAGSLGLLGIEERLAAFGGTLRMEANEPRGTRVRLRVPVTGYRRAS